VVDRAGDVVEVEDTIFEEPPETLTGESRRLIKGTFKLEETLLLVLDVEHAVALGTAGKGEISR
jgi:purine-binding chemotaxis protein CheW